MFASYLSLHINKQKASGSESPVASSRGSEEVVEFLEWVWGSNSSCPLKRIGRGPSEVRRVGCGSGQEHGTWRVVTKSVKFHSLLSDYLLFSVSLCSSPFLLSCNFRISCDLLSFYLLFLSKKLTT